MKNFKRIFTAVFAVSVISLTPVLAADTGNDPNIERLRKALTTGQVTDGDKVKKPETTTDKKEDPNIERLRKALISGESGK